MFGFDPTYSLLGAFTAAITAILPMWMFNLVNNRPISYRVFRYDNGNLNLFRVTMLLVVAVAFVNSAFQAALAKAMLNINPDPQLTIGFLVGDVIGGFVCIVVTIICLRLLLRRGFDAI